jgi:hypothetical protein
MGLLEDAIREHLELKRLRGADPSEVAREQHEALDPPAGQRPHAAVEDPAAAGEREGDAAGPELDADGAATGEHPGDGQEAPTATASSQVGEETAELDMQAVLANEPSAAGEHAAPADSELAEGGDPSAGLIEEDSLEWEVPAGPSRDLDSDPGLHEGENHDAVAEGQGAQQPPPESAEALEDGHAGAQPNAPGQGRLSL